MSVPEWFYESSGARLGPHTNSEMQGLAHSGRMLADTLCWQPDFGLNWKPFSQTGLGSLIPTGGPPPLPPSHVSGFYAWLYALAPLIGTVIEQIIFENTSVRDIPTGRAVWGYMFVYAILAGLDSRAIARSGNHAVPRMWWFLLAPAYLWVRSRALGQRGKVHFWAMIAAFIGASVITNSETGKTFFFLGVSLPTCDSSYAQHEVISLFGTLPFAKLGEVTGISLSGQRETNATSAMRYCEGIVAASNGTTYPLNYSFEKRPSDIYVRVQLK